MRIPVVLGLALAFFALAARPCFAEDSGRLRKALPAETIAYVRVADYGDLLSRLKRTALGRMYDDDDSFEFAFYFIEALLDYQFPASRAARREGDIKGQAWSLRESLSLDLGEIIWFETKRPDGSTGWGLLVDSQGESAAVARIADGHCAQQANAGFTTAVLKRGRATLTVISDGEELAESGPCETILQYDAIFGLASDAELLAAVVAALDDASLDALRQNTAFAKSADRLDERSDAGCQVEFFLDPLALSDRASGVSIPSATADVGNAALSKTNGMVAIVGRLWVATDQFDALLDVECRREQPVTAVESLVALRSRDVSVESWSPANAASYVSVNCDLKAMRLALKQPSDDVESGGSFGHSLVQRLDFADHPSIDSVLDSLDGRFSRTTMFDSSLSPPREIVVYSAHYNDRDKLERALLIWAENRGSPLAATSYEGQSYFKQNPSTISASTGIVCACFLGDNLLIADHPLGIERAIDAHRGAGALGQQLDYRLVDSRLDRLAGKQEHGAVFFARPESYLKSYYNVLSLESNRLWLLQLSSADPLWRAAKRAIDENPLPPFEALEKHLAPCGGFIDDDQESLRLAVFFLRRGKTKSGQ